MRAFGLGYGLWYYEKPGQGRLPSQVVEIRSEIPKVVDLDVLANDLVTRYSRVNVIDTHDPEPASGDFARLPSLNPPDLVDTDQIERIKKYDLHQEDESQEDEE